MKIQQPRCPPQIGEAETVADSDSRMFIFEKEQTHQLLIVDINISANSETIDLYHLFDQYCPLKLNAVSIYDPEVNKFIPLRKVGAQLTGIVPRALAQSKVVMIRFKKRQEQSETIETDSGIQSGLECSRDRKDRSKERTIGEAIELVKKWRLIHLDSNKLGLKKQSLADAARAIGVSKKTLDDYYYQLRLGEFYNFDFTNNLNEKVGILRAYVKEFKPEREEKNKNMRHPKNLKIIESFDLDTLNIIKQAPPSPILCELRSPSSFKSLSLEEEGEQNFEVGSNPFMKDVMTSYEDKFFKNFEFLLDDPNDPFIQIDRNFKKKQCEQSNNDFFFF